MNDTLDGLIVELRADIQGLQSSLNTAASSVQRFSKQAESDVGGLQKAFDRLRTAVVSVTVAWAAFRVGREIVEAGMQMQALQNRMVAATGNATVAGDAMAYVRAESERLGLDLQTAAGSFASFSASSLRSGMTLQQTKDVFSSVAEAATALHLSAANTQSAFLALEQMASKGTVQMQELKLQLSQAIPGAFEIMAKAMGVSVQQLNKMMERGELLANEALPKLGAELHRQFGERAVVSADSAQAAFNRLGNALFEIGAKMADAGILDPVVESVQRMTKTLNDPSTIDGLTKFAAALGAIMEMALKVASAIGTALYKIGEFETKALALVGIGPGVHAEPVSIPVHPTVAADPNYSLGKASAPMESDAQKRAREKAASMAARVQTMMAGLITGSDPNNMEQEKAIASLNKQFLEEQKLLQEALEKKGLTEQQYREDSLKLELDYQARLAEIRKKYRDDNLSIEQQAAEAFLDIKIRSQEEIGNLTVREQAKNFSDTISQAAQHNRAFFALEKAAAIARALLAARESVVSAYNFGSRLGGPPLGAVFAGVAAAAQAANIAAIASTSYGGGSASVSNSGGSDTSSGSAESSPSSSSASAPVRQVKITLSGANWTIMSKNDIRDLIERIGDTLSDGSSFKASFA